MDRKAGVGLVVLGLLVVVIGTLIQVAGIMLQQDSFRQD